MLATYMRCMCNNNMEIRIASSSCPQRCILKEIEVWEQKLGARGHWALLAHSPGPPQLLSVSSILDPLDSDLSCGYHYLMSEQQRPGGRNFSISLFKCEVQLIKWKKKKEKKKHQDYAQQKGLPRLKMHMVSTYAW